MGRAGANEPGARALKILLLGKNGQLGFELQRALAPLGPVVALDRAHCDLAAPEQIRACVRQVQPEVIVNAAAYTAVDRAESEPEQAHAINAVAPGVLAQEALRLDALLVHYSTDYVFDGRKATPYVETDAAAPLNVYGASKRAGEQAVLDSDARSLILRTSWIFGVHGSNFPKTILRLAAERDALDVVSEPCGAPTSAALVADVSAQILGQYLRGSAADFPFGLYHLSASGSTQWPDYARDVVQAALNAGRTLRLRPERIRPIGSAQYVQAASRPFNSLLDTRKLREAFGLTLPDWRSGLDHVLEQLCIP